jgi:hypothetical protein
MRRCSREAAGGQGVAPQEAIRTLSLRVPQTQSVPGIAPLPLLNASGGGGTDLDMLLAALMKAFGQGGRGPQSMAAGGGPGPMAAPQGGSMAPPRITPREDGELETRTAPPGTPPGGSREELFPVISPPDPGFTFGAAGQGGSDFRARLADKYANANTVQPLF